jgi:hypothetical protein
MSCDYIFSLASGIWDEIGQPTAIAPLYISGWLVSDSNLGKLNNAINTCYYNLSGCIEPALGTDEQAIYKDIYLISYYRGRATATLNTAVSDSWLELKDDVSSIKRQNKNEISKTFTVLSRETMEDLSDKIYAYQRNRSEVGVISMGSGGEIVYGLPNRQRGRDGLNCGC